MITLNSSPLTLHAANNSNWWVYSSDLRFANRFNLKLSVINQSSAVYNTVLIPTNPSNYNILNIKNIIGDYVDIDFNPFITSATVSTSIKAYSINARESFEGLYIQASSVGGKVATASVINNTTLDSLILPATVEEMGFVGGSMTSDPIYIIGYTTASNTYINGLSFSFTTAATASSPTGSIGTNSEGYVIISGYTAFSEGPTVSSATKYAIKSSIDYLDYNSSDNFGAYTMLSSSKLFLTRSPRYLDIQRSEYSTLSFIQSLTMSVDTIYVIDNLGATYSKSIPTSMTQSYRLDIPSGTSNLSISSTASSYTITLKNGSATMSETFTYNISCLNTRWTPFRVVWCNSLGGYDYYTFKYISNSSNVIERSNFDRNLVYGHTNQDRGISTYRLNNFNSYTVVSDILTDSEADWLQDLMLSKEVYWIRAVDDLIPVTITNNSFDINLEVDNSQLEVSFRLSRTNKF